MVLRTEAEGCAARAPMPGPPLPWSCVNYFCVTVTKIMNSLMEGRFLAKRRSFVHGSGSVWLSVDTVVDQDAEREANRGEAEYDSQSPPPVTSFPQRGPSS